MSKNISWFEPEMTGEELHFLKAAIDRNFINDGPLTRQFEEQIACLVEVEGAVAVPSGTIALTAILMALDIGPGDEVIVPDLTFIATANAVRLAGAKPVLIDVTKNRFTIDASQLDSIISTNTKAIIAVDVNGRGAAYELLEQICKESSLLLVCDAAEALGSRYNGKPLGSFGIASAFSFSANKTVTTGQGGMVVSKNKELLARVRQIKDQGRLARGTGGDDLHPTTGYNFKYTDLQAAVGLAQLKKLSHRCEQSKLRDQWYRNALRDCPGVHFPDYDSQVDEVRQWTDILIDDREKVRQVLDASGVSTRGFWFPLHTQKPYQSQSLKGRFSNAVEISANGLWLPSNFKITQQEVELVSELIWTAVTN